MQTIYTELAQFQICLPLLKTVFAALRITNAGEAFQLAQRFAAR